MRRLLLPLLLLAGLACGPKTAAQYYYFEHYTTNQGLPSNTIYCTTQDRFGFMWIGTRDGLCRFDGYDFRGIGEGESDDTTSLTSMNLTEDEDGLLWFSSADGIGYYNPYTGETVMVGRLGSSLSFDLVADRKGSVWFASDKLYRYVKSTGNIQPYSFESNAPSHIAIDSYDAIWVLLRGGDLCYYDKRQDRFTPVAFDRRLTNIRTAEGGKLLASTSDGEIILIETANMTGTSVYKLPGLDIRCILERKPGEYWIGTNRGLFIKTPQRSFELHHDAGDPNSLSANLVTSLDMDKSGNVWIGTYYTGINIWQDKQEEFSIFYPNPSPSSMIGRVVRSIATDEDGGVWFCTEDGGLNCLPNNRSEGIALRPVQGLNMQDLIIIGDDIWIHTFGDGVYVFDRKKLTVKKHYEVRQSSGCGLLTAGGKLYTGSQSGLYVYDSGSDSFVREDASFREFVHTLFQDSRGNVWIGTYGDGLYCQTEGGNRIAHLQADDRRHGLTSDRITSFFEDSRHRIWITTEGGGICCSESEPNLSDLTLRAITRADGMASNVTCAVAEDEDGLLWVSTTRGISRIDGETFRVEDHLFDRQQIIGSQYSYGAVETSRGGTIYMGNTSGLLSFSPAKIKRGIRNYQLYITSIEARNGDRTLKLHEPDRATIQSERIRVKSRDASQITVSFAAPEYSILQMVAFRYSLSRGRREISSATLAENHVTFSGLRPGRYRFDVGILGSDTPAANKSLEFVIQPPLLLSRSARIFYLAAFLGLLGLFFYELEMKRRRDRARHLTRLENQKQKEIYDAKINFFTNITHEIRTPLTLIKMPLDKIIAEKEYTPKSEKDLLTIQANTDRLLNLTNQLLDLRKMEQNGIKPVFLKEDLCKIVRKSCRYFEQMAEEQKISLHEDIPEKPFEVMCARDSVEKIVSNLLSNAVKYTKDRIDVSLKPSTDARTAILRVSSNGAAIPAREAEKIFEIFYQVDDANKSKGTGLGLAFARSLAGLHNGRLYLDTDVHDANSFVLELPVEQQTPVKLEKPQSAEPDELRADYDSSRHTLLVVEDSVELRQYLAGELSDEYNIVTAANGQDAVEKLQEERIDLVVSDIMMPLMDGCQLCNYIKTNMEYSHLPVLLLTAAVGVETRLQTLEVGADAYIEKPFPIELLRANIASLFKNRDIAYRQFTDSPLTHFNSVNSSKMDEEFMEKLHGIVMKHMAEQDLSIETLTTLIGTSKSTLYRKVKANTGLNINEYIRLCRLKQAAEMLSSQKYRINEVAYMVGFSSPSYFATSFQKQFNISPSAFVKNLKD
ncbi:MAG: response regulator [Bacteroidales bacterium]|nr:response regulator [Bacteroidales bacterium]